MKKVIYVLALAAMVLGFVSCGDNAATIPYATFKTNLGEEIEEGQLLDPAQIEYIDIVFDQPMDTTKNNFLGWSNQNGGTWSQILDWKWVNNSKFRVWVDLRYNHDFKIGFNQLGDRYDESDFFVSRTGVYAEFDSVFFSTIESPKKNTPQNYTIDLDVNLSVKLTKNKYGENQQCIVEGLQYYLNHDYVRPGDKVTINYKLTSLYDLSKVRVNLVDTSSVANYWTVLTDLAGTDNDLGGLNLVDNTFKVSTVEEENVYTGKLEFDITKRMIDQLDVQLVAPLADEFYSIDLLKIN